MKQGALQPRHVPAAHRPGTCMALRRRCLCLPGRLRTLPGAWLPPLALLTSLRASPPWRPLLPLPFPAASSGASSARSVGGRRGRRRRSLIRRSLGRRPSPVVWVGGRVSPSSFIQSLMRASVCCTRGAALPRGLQRGVWGGAVGWEGGREGRKGGWVGGWARLPREGFQT